MHQLQLPELGNFETFKDVASQKVFDENQLDSFESVLREAESEYLIECRKSNFNYHSSVNPPVELPPSQMTDIYNSHLRRGNGKLIYAKILKGSDQNSLCAYCGLREAESADHYKTKSSFPLLAVFPGNLVPACGRCNSKLGILRERYHPYFDPTPDESWLNARLIWTGDDEIPGMYFEVNRSFSQDESLVFRVEETFNKIGLSGRWATELTPKIRGMYQEFRTNSSAIRRREIVNDMLIRDYQEYAGPHRALYYEVLNSDWINYKFSHQ